MELLLLLLRHSGFQLRSDDAQALKQIVSLVKEKASAAVVDATATPGSNTDNTTIATADLSTEQTSEAESLASVRSAKASTLAEETGRWKAAFGVSSALGKREIMPGVGQQQGDDETMSGEAAHGSRARYVLDAILELQSNKRNRLQEQGQESGRRVRKWLGAVKSAKGGVGVARSRSAAGGGGGSASDTSLRVSWAELVSTESKGRWWRVGAAWAGRTAAERNGEGQAGDVVGAAMSTSDCGGKGGGARGAIGSAGGYVAEKASGGSGEGNEEREGGKAGVSLSELAVQQRMNTDVRRSVFVAIVGSLDCEDALEKILRLNLKGAQEREIARVIVECCCQEGSYNPFYAHLAERACDRQPKMR